MTNQCNHGQLRRQCEVCDLTARLAEAERERDDLQTRLNTASHQITYWQKELNRANGEGDELRDEVARLTDCLKKANDSIEKYERLYYLEMDAHESAEARLVALREAVTAIITEMPQRMPTEMMYRLQAALAKSAE